MVKTSKNIDRLRFFLKYLKPHIGFELLILASLVIESAGSLATPYALKIIIDDIFPKGNYTQLIQLLIGLVAIYIIRISCTVFIETSYANISEKIVSQIRSDMLVNILNRPIGFFKEVKSGDLLYTIMNDVQNIQSSVSSLILSFLDNLLTVIGILIMLGILNFKLTLISLFLLPVIFFSIRKFSPHLQQSFRRIQEIQGSINNFFIEKIRNIRVIKSYNTHQFEHTKLWVLQRASISNAIRNALMNSMNGNIITFLVAVGPIIVLIYGGKMVFQGGMTIGALIAFIQYLNRLFTPTISIMNSYNQFNKALVSMERVYPYIDRIRPGTGQKILNPVNIETITFKSVNYVVMNKEILSNVNMFFQTGKIYGIVGPSGSGKSTIINLFCGFILPTEGSIIINDQFDLNSFTNWQSNLGLIEKENQLFNGTILENLEYGGFEQNGNSIANVCEDAELQEFINVLPEGLNTLVNETGTFRSDGQKQRISVARAFYKNAKVIILDEATSALDEKLERKIIKKLRLRYSQSIIIVITHRLSILSELDYLYSLDEGKIKFEGQPGEILLEH
jgi:ABC-type multidrug transport system fused ATPase/permease subunit